MALGAQAGSVLFMVLKAGLLPALIGSAIGLAGSFALSRTISTFLYQTSPFDPVIYISVTALLLAVTTAACLIPARRAASVDPMSALRHE
jgi:ABC-type antimicrobial peptide transport system permease subunit